MSLAKIAYSMLDDETKDRISQGLGSGLTITEESWTSDGSTSVFNLTKGSYSPGTSSLFVFVDGVKQVATTNFVETNGTSFNLMEVPRPGDLVEAMYFTVTLSKYTDITSLQGFQENVATPLADVMTLINSVTPEDYQAVGDGVTDATTFIQNALNAGKNVYLPSGKTYLISATLNFKNNNQFIDGLGTLKAKSTLDGPVILGTNLNKLRVKNITIQASGSVNSIGVKFDGCYRSFAEYASISNYGADGVSVTNSTWITVRKNEFTNAVSNPTFGSSSARDVNIFGTNSNCVVSKNIMKSNGGYGVQIRTFNDNEHNDYHTVKENNINGYNSYGIMLYRDAQVSASVPLQSVSYCEVVGNIVKNISGSRPADMSNPTQLTFGCGIYLQGSEFVEANRNIVDTVCTSSNSELLTPAGIGLNNLGNAIIKDNWVLNSSMYGLYTNDANGYGDQNGKITFEGNHLTNITYDGVKIVNRNNVEVIANPMYNVRFGVMCSPNTGTQQNISVNGNKITKCSQTGVNISNTNFVTVAENQIDTATTHGISFGSVSGVTVTNNRVKSATSRGYYFDSACTGLNIMEGNTATSCGTGIYVNAPVKLNGNITESNTTNWDGTYSPLKVLADNTTPDVKYRTVVTIAPSAATTITNFLNGEMGQILTIQATNGNATIQHGTNIFLQGATNFTFASNSTLTLLKTSGIWVEVGRKA